MCGPIPRLIGAGRGSGPVAEASSGWFGWLVRCEPGGLLFSSVECVGYWKRWLTGSAGITRSPLSPERPDGLAADLSTSGGGPTGRPGADSFVLFFDKLCIGKEKRGRLCVVSLRILSFDLETGFGLGL